MKGTKADSRTWRVADEVLELTLISSASISVVPKSDEEAMNAGQVSSALMPREPNLEIFNPNPAFNELTKNVQEEPQNNDDHLEFEFCKDKRRIRRKECRWEGGIKPGASVVGAWPNIEQEEVSGPSKKKGLDKKYTESTEMELGMMENRREEEMMHWIEEIEKRDTTLFAK
ncbi:hypothetical protein Ancab_022956 [Ancistrocladus abbreviatus]